MGPWSGNVKQVCPKGQPTEIKAHLFTWYCFEKRCR
jgi:hypothetical protein